LVNIRYNTFHDNARNGNLSARHQEPRKTSGLEEVKRKRSTR
jgi:hypothetical protein